MNDAQIGRSNDPKVTLEHFRDHNRQFDGTDEETAYRLEACLEAQLAELGLLNRHVCIGEDGEATERFDYLDPKAVRVIIDAFMNGKLPQPEGAGSFLYSDRTALGRQAALDVAIERIKAAPAYDVTTDPDLMPKPGAVNG